ncbi:MAG: hypothetical protein PVH60_11610, partial [Anaerolineales bacterium]
MKRFLVGALYALVISSLLLTACGRDGEEPPATTGTEGLPDPVQTTEAAPDPDEAARQFLNAWEAGDYAAMYAL